jgi:hypothetical protein
MTATLISATLLLLSGTAQAAKMCIPCPAGQWTGSDGSCVSCKEVLGNTKYCPGGGVAYNCPENTKTIIANANSSADCEILCNAGQYYDGAICKSCPAGSYQDATEHQITSCMACTTTGYVTTTDKTKCCAANGNTCLTGNVRDNRPSGVRIQGGCFGSSGQQAKGSSDPGEWYYCHCRGVTSNGAVSSWKYGRMYSGSYISQLCPQNCNNLCSNNVSSWGAGASW